MTADAPRRERERGAREARDARTSLSSTTLLLDCYTRPSYSFLATPLLRPFHALIIVPN